MRSLLRGMDRASGDDEAEAPTRVQAWERIAEGISLPTPRRPEPAGAGAGDRTLQQLLGFLAAQAVVLTPPALPYLAGVDHHAGPLAMYLRHAAVCAARWSRPPPRRPNSSRPIWGRCSRAPRGPTCWTRWCWSGSSAPVGRRGAPRPLARCAVGCVAHGQAR